MRKGATINAMLKPATLSLLVFFLVLTNAAIVYAAARPPLVPEKCPAGSSSEVSKVQSILLTEDIDRAEAGRFLDSAIYCPNACYDLQANFKLTNSGMQVDISAVHVCSSRDKAPDEPTQSLRRGCTEGLQMPQIAISLEDIYSNWVGFRIEDQTIQKSRCDWRILEESMDKFMGGLDKVNPFGNEFDKKKGQSEMEEALGDLRAKSDIPPELVGPASGSGQVGRAFTPAEVEKILVDRGVSVADARKIISNRESAEKLIEALTKGGDTTPAIREAAEIAGVELNPDVVEKITALTPPPRLLEYGEGTGAVEFQGSPETTFNAGGAGLRRGFGFSLGNLGGLGSVLSTLGKFGGSIKDWIGDLFSSREGERDKDLGKQLLSQQPADALVYSQQSVVNKGDRINVSWSSIGMKEDVPCEVVMKDSSGTERNIAQRNEGTELVETEDISTGTVTFMLVCTSQAGDSVERESFVEVQ